MSEAAGRDEQFDAIIVGSGTCGATIARELSRRKKKVLILERGGDAPVKENLWGIASVAKEVPIGEKLKEMQVSATGGATSIYFGVAELPDLEAFRSMGVELARELEEVRREVPLAELPDGMMGAQALRLRDSAQGMGLAWKKNPMLVDLGKCASGYSHEAKWKARSFVQEAVADGATLRNGATALKVVVDRKRTVGLEYKVKRGFGHAVRKASAPKVILAGGAYSSPLLLRKSGIGSAASRGFYVSPSKLLFGFVPGLAGKENFMGSMSAKLDGDISLGDANLSRFFFRLMMLASLKPLRFGSLSRCISVGIKVRDEMGGELRNGRYHKVLTRDDHRKLEKGEEAARKILRSAGASGIFATPVSASGMGGLLRIHEDVDANLQTEVEGLHVCDGSLMPESSRISPTVTLLCLAKYLSKSLLKSL
jgi:hypothetical protein